MEFNFETTYDQKALTAMAKGLRKTIRKKKSQRSHLFGWIVVVLSILLMLSREEGLVLNAKNLVTGAAIVIIVAVTIWEDALNGFIAGKRMLRGTIQNTAVFGEDGYETATEVGNSNWVYSTVQAVAETKDYFVLAFSANHAQVYDKSSMNGGTIEEFRIFISEKTGKVVQYIK